MNIWTLLRAAAVVLGSLAALLTGGIAHADPAPAVPVPNIGDQLISSVASAPQLLQNLASALGAVPPAPAAPPPLAGAAISVPQPLPAAAAAAPAIAVPGLPSAAAPAAAVPGLPSAVPGTTAGIPGITSAVPGIPSAAPGAIATAPRVPSAGAGTTAGAPATGPGQLMPQAQVNLPQVPFLPVPLPQQVSLPGDLASIAPGGVPVPHGIAAPSASAVPAAAAPPAAPVNPLLVPLSALP